MIPLPSPFPDEDYLWLLHRIAKMYGCDEQHDFYLKGQRLCIRYWPSCQILKGLLWYAKQMERDPQRQLKIICNHSLLKLSDPYKPIREKASNRVALIGNKLISRYVNMYTCRILQNEKSGFIEKVRICPLCQKEQSLLFGTTYINRLWQMAGMDICPKHGCALHEKIVHFYGFREKEGLTEPVEPRAHAEAFATLGCEYLRCGDLNLNRNDWTMLIKSKLKSTSWQKRRKEILPRLKLRWGDLEKSYGIGPCLFTNQNWNWWKVMLVMEALEPGITAEKVMQEAREVAELNNQ